MKLEPLPQEMIPDYDNDSLVYKSDDHFFYGSKVSQDLIADLAKNELMLYAGYYTFHAEDDFPRLYYHGRGKSSGKIRLKIQGYIPYCYDFSENSEFETYLGKRCDKLIFKGHHPSRVAKYRESKVKRGFPQPLEADILFIRRFLCDTYDYFKPANPIYPKMAIVDVETDYPVSNDLISYALNDLNTGEIWYASKYDGCTPKELASDIVEKIKNYDVISGWNIDFDIKMIEKNSGIRLSEIVASIDLLEISKKMKETELRGGWDLDNAGKRIVGVAKTLDEKDMKVDIRDLSEEKLMQYNIMDCIIPEIIDCELGGLEGHLLLAWSLQSCVDDMIIHAVVNDIALLRAYHRNGIVLNSREYTDTKSKEFKYRAAEPDARPGVYEEIIVLDIIHAYPVAVIGRNISCETKDINGIHIAPNGVRFNDNKSIFIETLKELMKDRAEVKKQLKSIDKSHPDYSKLKSIDFALKTQIAAFSHGIFGWGNSRMKDFEVADAITSVVRDLLNKIKNSLGLIGKKWIYTHTDAIFINANKNEKDEIVEYVNNVIKNYCKDFKVLPEMEFKGFYPIGFIHSAARNVLVPEGIDINDDENWEVTGMNYMRKETPLPLARIEIDLVKSKLKYKSNEELLFQLKNDIMKLPEADTRDLGLSKPLKKSIKSYGKKLQDGSWGNIPYHIKALIRAKEEYGFEVPIGGEYYIIPILTEEVEGKRKIRRKRIEIAYSIEDGLPDKYKIDWQYYLQGNLWGKIHGIFNMKPKELENKILEDTGVCEKLGIEYGM